jgi:hypothetical protein
LSPTADAAAAAATKVRREMLGMYESCKVGSEETHAKRSMQPMLENVSPSFGQHFEMEWRWTQSRPNRSPWYISVNREFNREF